MAYKRRANYLLLRSAIRTEDSGLQILNERGNYGVFPVGHEHLGGSYDGLNVLQIDDDGAFSAKDGGRVGEEGIEDPQIAAR